MNVPRVVFFFFNFALIKEKKVGGEEIKEQEKGTKRISLKYTRLLHLEKRFVRFTRNLTYSVIQICFINNYKTINNEQGRVKSREGYDDRVQFVRRPYICMYLL